jgi:tetratricopeptide (TPR) repeat protein
MPAILVVTINRVIKRLFKTQKEPDAAHVEKLSIEATSAARANDFKGAVGIYDEILALKPNWAQAHYQRANALKNLSQFAAARSGYEAAIKLEAGFAHAWCNLGTVLQNLALHDLALESYDQAILLDPSDALAHSNRGSLLQALGDWSRALESFDEALGLNPHMPYVWFHRGNVLKELGRFDAALTSYSEAIKLKPDYAEAHYNCGVLRERGGQLGAALTSYEHAIAIFPTFHEAHYNRAGILRACEKRDVALEAYGHAILSNANYPEAYLNRGVLLQELGKHDAALKDYETAISLRPGYAEAYLNRGVLLGDNCRFVAALECFEHAIALKPDYPEAYCDRGRILTQLARLDEAISSYNRAIAIRPDFAEAQYNMGLTLLLAGDYERGWLQYEWRWKNRRRLSLEDTQNFQRPLWLGDESIVGKKVLLHWEQGFGDTLQFCRFATAVHNLGATVILEVQQPLVSLLVTLDGVSQLTVRGDSLPEYDYHCPLMSLPLALKVSIDSIPKKMKYLTADANRVAKWRERLGPANRPRVGITWSGNSRQGHDRDRSIKLAEWIEYLPSGFQYFSLQKDINQADLNTLTANPMIERIEEDFSETAALCECVDLVISVCTSIAHLSGALGRPTWVLLAFAPDWRWLLNRGDSPWYPTAKLYRQTRMGDWSDVLKRVRADLQTGAVDGSYLR